MNSLQREASTALHFVQAMSLLPLLENIKHDNTLLKHSARLYACGLLGGNFSPM
jgi:hypothetical protein